MNESTTRETPESKAGTPEFTPSPGTYDQDIDVEIAADNGDAIIHYTTDGTAPDQASEVYQDPVSISGNDTVVELRAIAVRDGMSDSEEASGTFEIRYPKAASPIFTPQPGIYQSDLNVELSVNTSEAEIRYTSDGSTPSESSSTYEQPIELAGDGSSVSIHAIAVAEGYRTSEVAVGEFSIDYSRTSQVQMMPGPGEYGEDKSITLSTPTEDATIRYTLDGAAPSAESSLYTSPIEVSGDGEEVEIRAIAFKDGYKESQTSGGVYSIDYPVAPIPVIEPATGTYSGPVDAEISVSDDSASVYYATDASTQPDSFLEYTSSIQISETTTIRAYAELPMHKRSPLVESTITLQTGTVGIDDQTSPSEIAIENLPASITADEQFTVYLSADGSPSISWYLDGSPMEGETGPTLDFPLDLFGYGPLPVGVYELKAIARDNQRIYSNSKSFEVTN